MHTKGPWTRVPKRILEGSDHGILIESSNGEYVAMALDLHPFNRDDEIEANARLLAAAPDLLEELNNLVGVISILKKMVGSRADGINVTFADQLIAEAKGIQSSE